MCIITIEILFDALNTHVNSFTIEARENSIQPSLLQCDINHHKSESIPSACCI